MARGLEPVVELAHLVPGAALTELTFASSAEPVDMLATLCRAVYDPRRDDADFRRSLMGDEAQRRAAFDLLRKQYPSRREIDGLAVRIVGQNPALEAVVAALGARLLD
jgi:erythronate-4-phosphate dehydrogenase